MVYGVAGMLTIAAFLEAFWSPSAAPAQIKLIVGGLLWLYVLFYFLVAGRSHGS